jgi:hypothetical protein
MPRIDKPAIYKVVSFLEKESCIELRQASLAKTKGWIGLAKYYRITPKGYRMILMHYRDFTESRPTSKIVLRMLEKNPHLEYEKAWFETYCALRPLFAKANKNTNFRELVGSSLKIITSDDPMWVLGDLIAELVSNAKDEDVASASIRELLEVLRSHPADAYRVKQLISERLVRAHRELTTAKAQLAKIKRVTSDLADSGEKIPLDYGAGLDAE